MNEIEDRLRDAFGAGAQIVSPQSLRGLPTPLTRTRTGTRRPGPPRRGRPLVPLAAAAAVIAVIVAATALPLLGRGSGSGPGASLPAGVPRFYVISYEQESSPVIRSTATGQVTGTLRVPRGHFISIMAPLAGDDSYIALVEPLSGYPGPSGLEEFSISRTGRPGALRPLGVTVPPRDPEFAVTPDGHAIAFFIFGAHGGKQTQVEVVNRLTGQTRTWTGCVCETGLDYPFILSLSASGRLLAAPPLRGNESYGVFGVRLLRTTARSGSYTGHSRFVLPDAYWATLSLSGSTLYACLSHYGLHRSTWVAYDIATGRRRIIARWRGALYGGGGGCQGVASASGRYVLVQLGGAGERAEVLDLRTGRVIPLHHGYFGGGDGYPYW